MILTNPAIAAPFCSPNFYTTGRQKQIKLRVPGCSRDEGQINGSYEQPLNVGLEVHASAELTQASTSDPEFEHNDIWRLFKEAQHNILYLNKQRMVAMEELKRTQEENRSLLVRIEELEGEKQIYSERDRLSSLWQLLLRVDSMVVTAIISPGDASDIRRIILDDKTGLVEVLTPLLQQGDSKILAEVRKWSTQSKRSCFHILHICTEMEPVISVGPLASYVAGLSQALQRKGNLVGVILPKYKTLDFSEVDGLREIPADFYSYFNGQLHENRIWTGVVGGVGATFIEPVYYSSFFNRERVYGYPDDIERFSYFSRAALDYIVKSGNHPDILHIHNGETALSGPLFWDVFVNQVQPPIHQGLGDVRIILTCQGFDSQYVEQPDKLGLCGLDPLRLHRHDRLQDNAQNHLVNILKGGVVYSNKVIVMSSFHSKSKILQSQAQGLEPTLSIHKDKLVISPRGFDQFSWDPSTDIYLPENYSVENMAGKSACKVALQRRMGLSEDTSAVLVSGILAELSDVDLENLMGVVQLATIRGIQVILMGSWKTSSFSKSLNSFHELENEGVVLIDQYDEALAHLILGGSDLMLCPSYDDPVFQVPMKAVKYGTVPISVPTTDQRFRHSFDYDHGSTHFAQYINTTFANVSLTEALDEMRNNTLMWRKKIEDAMKIDFSWDAECCDMHISAYESVKKS